MCGLGGNGFLLVWDARAGRAAASMLASLPPVLIVVGLQRFLVGGLLARAVKD